MRGLRTAREGGRGGRERKKECNYGVL